MSKKTEALKLALAFIEDTAKYLPHVYDAPGLAVHTAIREALAEQPAQQQEPVAWMVVGDGEYGEYSPGMHFETLGLGNADYWKRRGYELQPLYTSPPASKPWVGLTDEERGQVISANFGTGLWSMAKDIEAKLREKNA